MRAAVEGVQCGEVKDVKNGLDERSKKRKMSMRRGVVRGMEGLVDG